MAMDYNLKKDSYVLSLGLSFFDQKFTVDLSLEICPPLGWRDGALVRALASHQCGPCSILIRGLSLLVVYSAPRGVFLGTPVSPLPQNQNLIRFALIC